MTRRQLGVFALSAAAATAVSARAGAQPPLPAEQLKERIGLAQVQRLNEDLARRAERYDGARWRLGVAERDARKAQRSIARAERQLRIGRRRFAAQLVAVYEGSDDASLVDVLLGSTSVRDALDRRDVASRHSRARARTVEQLLTARAELARQGRRLAVAERARAAQVQTLGAERTALTVQLRARRRALASITRRLAAVPAPPPPPTATDPQAPAVPSPSWTDGGVAGVALRYLGAPYLWGGATPAGFDCSGFVMYVFQQVGVGLPHFAAAQYQLGEPVDRTELQPGDLVFFDGLAHEGIYLGNGEFVHAPHTGDVVKISTLSGWFLDHWVGARRIGG